LLNGFERNGVSESNAKQLLSERSDDSEAKRRAPERA
jgi:hypothetical protein